MKLNPYLSFDGNAREALDYYCATLGATLTSSMTYGEMPGDFDWVNDGNKHRLANGQITLGDQSILASDGPGFEPHKGFEGVTLQTSFDNVDEAKAFFDKLAADGTVRMPFEPTFWAKGFGMLTDKFGVSWMVNVLA